jgi:hypothetical protein
VTTVAWNRATQEIDAWGPYVVDVADVQLFDHFFSSREFKEFVKDTDDFEFTTWNWDDHTPAPILQKWAQVFQGIFDTIRSKAKDATAPDDTRKEADPSLFMGRDGRDSEKILDVEIVVDIEDPLNPGGGRRTATYRKRFLVWFPSLMLLFVKWLRTVCQKPAPSVPFVDMLIINLGDCDD